MSESTYKIPFYNRLLRAILRPTFRGIFYLISKVQIEGRERVPSCGPYLIVFNHISIFDPPFLVAFWPCAPEVAGAVEVWSRPGVSLLARIYGGIQVHRGQYDRKLIVTLSNVLKTGYPLVIAPEGGRSHKPSMKRAHPGVAYLVDRAQVPVVPVGITGTTEDFFSRGIRGKRPTITMHIGEPITLPPIEGRGKVRRDARQDYSDEIMRHIAALMPKEYGGVYAQEESSRDKP